MGGSALRQSSQCRTTIKVSVQKMKMVLQMRLSRRHHSSAHPYERRLREAHVSDIQFHLHRKL